MCAYVTMTMIVAAELSHIQLLASLVIDIPFSGVPALSSLHQRVQV